MKMKATSPHGLLPLSFILFFLLCASAQHAVLDIEGNEVQAGELYTIQSATIDDLVHSLSVTQVNGTCRYYVVQESFPLSPDGIPLRFHPVSLFEQRVVRLSSDVNIEFVTGTTCAASTVWKVDVSTKENFITLDGKKGRVWCETVPSRFKIEPVLGSIYKLVFHPESINPLCSVPPTGRDVGILIEDGHKRLALNGGYPLLVVFMKFQCDYSDCKTSLKKLESTGASSY